MSRCRTAARTRYSRLLDADASLALQLTRGFLADGYAVSTEADEALSRFMGNPVRLVRKGPKARPGGSDDPRGEDSKTTFQDFHSLTVASAESLRHVQKTLVASVYPEAARGDDASVGTVPVESFPVPGSLNREFWTREWS